MDFYKIISQHIKFKYFAIALSMFSNQAMADFIPECIFGEYDNSNNLCEQNSRSRILTTNWNLLDALNKDQEFDMRENSEIGDAKKDIIVAKLMVKPVIQWPRPKTLNRYYQSAVESLDISGKRDLRTCIKSRLSFLQENENEFELIAAFKFSNQFSALIDPSVSSTKEISAKGCEQLFNLILGKA